MRGETMVASLVGASDTFKLVTTEGAARLSRQSRERKALIANMVTAASEEQSRPTGADSSNPALLLTAKLRRNSLGSVTCR